jgi:hypothetical protein
LACGRRKNKANSNPIKANFKANTTSKGVEQRQDYDGRIEKNCLGYLQIGWLVLLVRMGRSGFEPPTHGFSALDSVHKSFADNILQVVFCAKTRITSG